MGLLLLKLICSQKQCLLSPWWSLISKSFNRGKSRGAEQRTVSLYNYTFGWFLLIVMRSYNSVDGLVFRNVVKIWGRIDLLKTFGLLVGEIII